MANSFGERATLLLRVETIVHSGPQMALGPSQKMRVFIECRQTVVRDVTDDVTPSSGLHLCRPYIVHSLFFFLDCACLLDAVLAPHGLDLFHDAGELAGDVLQPVLLLAALVFGHVWNENRIKNIVGQDRCITSNGGNGTRIR